ncbi:WXG100 family type VII secretion target [Microbacterium paraoxydans]|uniref:WXG100 family type VII secretion target n=1 Tax=Microbacterium paraoxydans TaxID=199592 RepID=UPI0021A9630A|nr:WXG100 family type VII secretion target [Microbacterium paraoxydans]MCT2223354.1 WXG100 family type VII secretion target [Microbacterium paraoxydans]
MATIEVNPSRLAAAARSIGDASANIDAALEQLLGIAGVLRDSWSGEAQSAFDSAHGRFDLSMRERSALVDAIATTLDDLATSYSETDLAGQRALGG